MKIIKAVMVLLLLANVALYLWTGVPADSGRQVPAAQPEVNREGMLLLPELPAAGRAERVVPAGAAAVSCYRIGPFKKEADWLAATRWMEARQFPYQAVRSERREMRAIRVFLGPFDSQAAAQPMTEWLAAREIEHFLAPGEGEQVRISLGYFTQEALAVKFVAHLLFRGVTANTRVEYRAIGPFDWMEGPADATRRDLLAAHRWPGKGVAMLQIPCGAVSPSVGSGA